MIHRARRNLKIRAEVALAQAQGDEVPGETGLDYEIYREPSEPKWHEAWELTEQLLVATADEAHAIDARFLVVMVSNAEQVHPDPDVRQRFMKRLGVSDLDYPELRIARLCDEHGIEILRLAPPMAAYAETHHQYLHGFANAKLGRGHWNAQGHRVAAELIAARIEAMMRDTTALSPAGAGSSAEGEKAHP
jgi:hypothetical protein